jgi:hypothetical protein
LAGFFLFILGVLRVGTYWAFKHDTATLTEAWPAFALGVRFDLRVVAAAMLVVVALGAWPQIGAFRSPLARRGWYAVLGVFSATLAVTYVVDFLHFRYLGQRLNASALGLLADTRISAAMVWETYPVLRWLVVLGIATAACVVVVRRLHMWAAAGAVPERRWVCGLWYGTTGLACAVGVFGSVSQYPLRWSDAFSLRSDFGAQLALNPVESFLSSLSFRASGYDAKEVGSHYLRMAAYLGITQPDPGRLPFERSVAAPPPATTAVRPPNVVLVICESFSAYKSSLWGNPLDTTPFFAELSKQGVFFDNCFTPHVGTARGVWATITGIPDVEMVETASRNPTLVDQHSIINDFVGYEKLYFLGGSTSWANIRGVLTNNITGLQIFESGYFKSPRVDVWGISDKSLFLEAHEVLRAQTKPFFAVIQTAGNHRPYTIPRIHPRRGARPGLEGGGIRFVGGTERVSLQRLHHSQIHRGGEAGALLREHAVRFRGRPRHRRQCGHVVSPGVDGPAPHELPCSAAVLRAEVSRAAAAARRRFPSRRHADARRARRPAPSQHDARPRPAAAAADRRRAQQRRLYRRPQHEDHRAHPGVPLRHPSPAHGSARTRLGGFLPADARRGRQADAR